MNWNGDRIKQARMFSLTPTKTLAQKIGVDTSWLIKVQNESLPVKDMEISNALNKWWNGYKNRETASKTEYIRELNAI